MGTKTPSVWPKTPNMGTRNPNVRTRIPQSVPTWGHVDRDPQYVDRVTPEHPCEVYGDRKTPIWGQGPLIWGQGPPACPYMGT